MPDDFVQTAHLRWLSSAQSHLKRNRTILLRADCHCYWCATATVPHDNRKGYLGNAATLDHLNHASVRTQGDHEPVVLACSDCNVLRDRLARYAIRHYPLTQKQFSTFEPIVQSYFARLQASLDGGFEAPGVARLQEELQEAQANMQRVQAANRAQRFPTLAKLLTNAPAMPQAYPEVEVPGPTLA